MFYKTIAVDMMTYIKGLYHFAKKLCSSNLILANVKFVNYRIKKGKIKFEST